MGSQVMPSRDRAMRTSLSAGSAPRDVHPETTAAISKAPAVKSRILPTCRMDRPARRSTFRTHRAAGDLPEVERALPWHTIDMVIVSVDPMLDTNHSPDVLHNGAERPPALQRSLTALLQGSQVGDQRRALFRSWLPIEMHAVGGRQRRHDPGRRI